MFHRTLKRLPGKDVLLEMYKTMTLREIGLLYDRTPGAIQRQLSTHKKYKEVKQQKGIADVDHHMSTPGKIYIIRLFGDFYKIGASRNPKSRIAPLQRGVNYYFSSLELGNPPRVEIVHLITTADMAWTERALHKALEGIRTYYLPRSPDSIVKTLTTEIFRLNQDELNLLLAFKDLNPCQVIHL